MTNMNIIGIAGKKYSGKDTMGDYLVKYHGYKKIAYADALKDVCKCIFGFTDEQLYGDKKEIVDDVWGKTPRELFQFIGTDLFREHFGKCCPEIGNNIWVTVVKNKIIRDMSINPNVKYVITDVRYPNEAEMITNLGGHIIKLHRNNLSIDTHLSETSIDLIVANNVYDNNGEKEVMYKYIESLLSKIK